MGLSSTTTRKAIRQRDLTSLHMHTEKRSGRATPEKFLFFLSVPCGGQFHSRHESSPDTQGDPGSQLPYQEFSPYYLAPAPHRPSNKRFGIYFFRIVVESSMFASLERRDRAPRTTKMQKPTARVQNYIGTKRKHRTTTCLGERDARTPTAHSSSLFFCLLVFCI
jgi:hypothetical protein